MMWNATSRSLTTWIILLTGISLARAELNVERVIGKEFPGEYKHPACIEQFDNGDLYIAYYTGQGEYADDTAVYGMRKRPGGAWTKPTVIADTPHRSEGNAVVWQDPTGVVWLFYVCRYGDTWSKSRIKAKMSKDRGHTWSDSTIIAFEQGMMVRNRPIVLNSGKYLLPVYLEKGDDREAVGAESTSRFLEYDAEKKAWSASGVIASKKGNVQPAVAVIGGQRLVAYCRRGGGYGPTTDGYLVRAESSDNGKTWSEGVDSQFPNPNAAVDFLRLRSGSFLLVYNRSMDDRTPLSAAISTDQDKSYPHRRDLVTGDGPFAYPFVIQGRDDTIHCVFTTEDRTVIKHLTFRESDIVDKE